MRLVSALVADLWLFEGCVCVCGCMHVCVPLCVYTDEMYSSLWAWLGDSHERHFKM